MKVGLAIITLALFFLLIPPADAQILSHLTFSAGAGPSFPTGAAGDDLNSGWNFGLSGGYNLTRHLSANLDFGYNRWGLNSSALAQFGEPDGHTSLWSLTFNPRYRFRPGKKLDFYTTAGFGLYHRNLELTQPATQTGFYCDPFFGYCYPVSVAVNEVVASFSTYKGGFNVGAGWTYRLGDSRWKVFSEARYQRMFTTYGDDLTAVPVTIGLRW
jgi:opacity protein-like surface antigen